ncbi:MAG: M20/M25/M40 family metallo-hydrolase [Chloroflexi bacterium]|nr:M20/M25/M40 family metallo-hydrolase [Chloroflexota bacterium]
MDISTFDKQLIANAWTSRDLYANLETLCDFGSRFAGSPSEAQARDFIQEKFHQYGLKRVCLEPFDYLGWWRGTCALCVTSPTARTFDAISLVYSPSTPANGITAPIVDVGMGTEKEYAAKKGMLAGKIVVCSSANPEDGRAPHRREKYGWAVDAGAVGFIYARHLPGGLPETGSLRAGRLGEIPAIAVSFETGSALKRLIGKGETVVTLDAQNESRPTTAYHVIGEVPGTTDEVIVVGAHYDGHDISQGANDDATGTCLVLELARLFAPLAGQLKRTIRFIAFACEELGVLGSTEYVKQHRDEMKNVAFMMNLDSGVGDGPKGFTFSGLDDVETFLKNVAQDTRYALRLREKIETASDHFPFFMEGVPAVMMLAKPSDRAMGRGFGHTPMDTLDKVNERDMHECAMVAARVLLRVAQDDRAYPRHRTPDEIKQILIAQELQDALKAQGKWRFE